MKNKLKAITEDIDIALLEVANKYNVSLKVRKSSYSTNEAVIQLDCGTIAADGNVITAESEAYRLRASSYDLPASSLFTMVTLGGRQMKIVGLRPRASRTPIALQGADGHSYVASAASVRRALEAAKP